MTVTDVPTHRVEVDEAQLLFEEARQRRKRRWLITGIATFAFVILFGIVVGLLAIRGGGDSPRPVANRSPIPSASAVTGADFSVRPVLCYAPPYSLAPGQAPSTGPLPSCTPSSWLTASNLNVQQNPTNVNGYAANNTQPDPQFAPYRSTTSSNDRPNQTVLLPGSPGQRPGRYILGPVGLGRDAIATAQAGNMNGQWTINLTLTGRGAVQWDALAAQQFHAIVGVVINGRVVSAPISQPSQGVFTSFHGQLQISGSFTEHQAKKIASEL